MDTVTHTARVNAFDLGNLLHAHIQVEPSIDPFGLLARQFHHRSVDLIAQLFVLQGFFRSRRTMYNSVLNTIVAIQRVISSNFIVSQQ